MHTTHIQHSFACANTHTFCFFFLTHLRTDLEAIGPMPEPDYTAMVVGPSHPCKLRYTRRVPLNKKQN